MLIVEPSVQQTSTSQVDPIGHAEMSGHASIQASEIDRNSIGLALCWPSGSNFRPSLEKPCDGFVSLNIEFSSSLHRENPEILYTRTKRFSWKLEKKKKKISVLTWSRREARFARDHKKLT
jgi:hypothetical protein